MPYDDKSLWGIEINPNTPEIHVDFKNLRDFNEKFYKEYWNMLSGNYQYQILENYKYEHRWSTLSNYLLDMAN